MKAKGARAMDGMEQAWAVYNSTTTSSVQALSGWVDENGSRLRQTVCLFSFFSLEGHSKVYMLSWVILGLR